MNRIRHHNNAYQVLLTPHLKFAPSMELLVGNWDDEHLRGFSIVEYPTLPEAQCHAMRLPDIDWYKLVRMHIDYVHSLEKIINGTIQRHKFIVNLETKVMTPQELKEMTFRRVQNLGERYSVTYGANDIISFCIVNPWTKNLDELAHILTTIPELRIKRHKIYNKKINHLIGLTELGSTYEIRLWPTILHHWAVWEYENKHINRNKNNDRVQKVYQVALKQQNDIDSGMFIR